MVRVSARTGGARDFSLWIHGGHAAENPQQNPLVRAECRRIHSEYRPVTAFAA
jgi:hypothetical protein